MDEAGVAGWVTSDELAEAGRFVREGRRREYLTWRAVVRRELGADVRIAYDAAGAPVVDRDGVYVGVSHCRGVWPSVCPMSPARSTSNPRRGFQPCRAALHVLRAGAVRRSVAACRCLVRRARRSTSCPAPGAGLAARPAGGGGGFCGWNRCRAHRRRGRRSGSRCIVPTGYHGIYGIVPAGLPAWESPSSGGAFPYVSCSRGAGS